MNIVQSFMSWWNGLAEGNGKVKFRNQREAAEFVRGLVNTSGGPNAKVIEMRREYETVRATQARNDAARPERRAVGASQR